MKEEDKEELEREADMIYLTSLLMGQIVIWLLVGLLVYSGIRLSVLSFSANVTKIAIVFLITAGLVALSIFMIKKGQKRVRIMRSKNE